MAVSRPPRSVMAAAAAPGSVANLAIKVGAHGRASVSDGCVQLEQHGLPDSHWRTEQLPARAEQLEHGASSGWVSVAVTMRSLRWS